MQRGFVQRRTALPKAGAQNLLRSSPICNVTARSGAKVIQRKNRFKMSVQATATPSPTHVSPHGLPRTAVIGILGGGQLGRMTALAAADMDVKIKVLDPTTPSSPASIVADQAVGSFRDAERIREFVKGCDVLTFEIEHVDVDAVEQVARETGIDVQPTPSTIRTIQDKYAQKVHFSRYDVPLPGYAEVNDRAALEAAGAKFGFPMMLKAKRLAYDGRGNAVVKTAADIDSAAASLGGFSAGLYVEQWAPFVKELAVMVVRSRSGEVSSYPIVQTIHKDSICLVTESPAEASEAALKEATRVAERAIASLEGAGVFGVEMFLLADGRVLLNEVAPRPHNSGHYTIEACASSQFEQHVRAVLGWPLGDTTQMCESSIMFNILGQADGDEGMRLAHSVMGKALATPGAKFHWYGKEGVSEKRKVGHVTICGPSRAETRRRLGQVDAEALQLLEATSRPSSAPSSQPASASGRPAPQVGVIMGSDSDLPTMSAAAQVLEEFGIPCEVTVVSAHRTPERMLDYAHNAHKRGIKVIIAGAGGAAHLPGMVAAMTPLPVIGVPVRPAGSHLDGVDALLSIVQMPRGVPVATVAIGNATNAGLLAVRILASSDSALLDKMLAYQEKMTETVLDKAATLESKGWREYTVKH